MLLLGGVCKKSFFTLSAIFHLSFNHPVVPDWAHFVSIEAGKWLDMATNWTVHSSPEKVKVVNYEEVR